VMGANAPRDFVYFVLALVAFWFGTSVSAREIIRERPVFKRERMVNLSIVNYVMSKFTLLAILWYVVTGIQVGRARTKHKVYAPATAGGTILNGKFQRSPAGAGTWTDICTDSTSPYSCSFDTTVPGDGLYDLRALATDNASRTATSTVSNRRVDNTAPSVTMTDPGSPLSGTISLAATATDVGGSGVSSVTIQRSPAGADTWTDVCTDPSSPYSCSFDTTTVGDALYDFRAVGTDVAGNSANSTVTNRRIDNVVPTVSLTDPGANIRGTISLDATASDGGGILDGLESMEQAGERLFRLMLQVASGERTKSELHGYGQNEFVPWQLGAVM